MTRSWTAVAKVKKLKNRRKGSNNDKHRTNQIRRRAHRNRRTAEVKKGKEKQRVKKHFKPQFWKISTNHEL